MIKTINAQGGYIVCPTYEERERIAALLHGAGIVHITTGPKTYGDYLQRVRKGVYDNLLVIGIYKSEFFSLLENKHSGFPFYLSQNIS